MPPDRRPTAVFLASDAMACGFIAEVQRCGLAVPRDLSVIGFDDIELVSHVWPPLTTVEQPVAAMAEAAVAALVGASRGEKPRHRIFPTTLRVRQSCGCP